MFPQGIVAEDQMNFFFFEKKEATHNSVSSLGFTDMIL